MEWSFPWGSVDGDREYDDGDFAQFYANLFTNGVSLTTADSLKVSTNPTGGMRVQVATGAAFVDGRTYFNSNPIALPISIASGTQDRVDSIVVRMDTGLRTIKLVVKSGSVTVNRTNDIYELQLATIRVPRNASNITADLITDTRANESVCGYSTPFQKVSVSGLVDQYQALIQEWFENLQNELDENQAINLQNQITKLKADQEIFSRTHDLEDYPNVIVTAWEGDAIPETIPAVITYPNLNELTVKVPVQWKLNLPTITETDRLNFLLVEGSKSMRIKIIHYDGFMTDDERSKLSGIEVGAQVNRTIATKLQAEAGTSTTTAMTPQRTREAILKLAPLPAIATKSEAETGTNNTKMMTPLSTKQAIETSMHTNVTLAFGDGISMKLEKIGKVVYVHIFTIASGNVVNKDKDIKGIIPAEYRPKNYQALINCTYLEGNTRLALYFYSNGDIKLADNLSVLATVSLNGIFAASGSYITS